MARVADTVLLSFSERSASRREGGLRIELIGRCRLPGLGPLATNPWSQRFLQWIRWPEVVDCYQPYTLSTDLGILIGRAWGKQVFVTDLGGGHRWALSRVVPLLGRANAMLLIFEYSRSRWHDSATAHRASLRIIWGGVDPERFSPGDGRRTGEVLFVGRLLPHKGVNYLVEAVPRDVPLHLVGRAYDKSFLDLLRERATGKTVQFHLDATDDDLIGWYRRALVTVLPSVYVAFDGSRSPQPELLGLVVLESLACGTPVIVTDVASLPELVEDGVTGFVVPPNDPDALRDRLRYCLAHPTEVERMGAAGRAWVAERFRWEQVVERCFRAYRAALGRVSFSGSSPPESPGAMADR